MRANSPQSASEGDHLLIIRFSAMGDVAMLAPVIWSLISMYPHLRITILTRAFFKPIFSDIPNVSVFAADIKGRHKGVSGLVRLSKELKGIRITGVADMHNVLRTNVLKALFLFSGLPFIQLNKGREEKKALTSTKKKVFRQLKKTHQRYADVLSELGYPVDLSRPVFPIKHELSPKILEVTGFKNQIWIGVAPFAAHDAKSYPTTLFAEVFQKLSSDKEIKIFLFGGGAEETIKLEALASNYSNIISLAGKFRFEEELKVISNLNLMVSMDSGNAHLAAIYGVKVLTIWGVTHPYAGFAAFNQPEDHNILPDRSKYPAIPTSVYGNQFPEDYADVIQTISPDEIVEKIKRMIT